MKRKAYLAALAVSVMCFAAAGCGKEETAEETKQTTEAQETEETEEVKEETEEETAEAEVEEAVDAEAEKIETVEYKPEPVTTVENIEKYITVGKYKGLSLENTVGEITEEDVDLQIKTRLQMAAEEVKDGTVENGDIATIDYIGTKDGEAFDGGTAEGYDLTIGSGTFIEGFEDGVIGMKAGETKDLNLTFPEDYPHEDLAGQEVVFQVTLQSIKRAPELTEEWVTKNTDFATVEEYKNSVKEEMKETEAKNAKAVLRNSAWEAVMTESEVKEYPEDMLNEEMDEYKKAIESMYAAQNMTLDEIIEANGISMDDFNTQCEQYAQALVKQNLLVQAIMDAEELSMEGKEAEAIQQEIVEVFSAESMDQLATVYGQKAVNEQVALLIVQDFIIENAEIKEQVASGETVGISGDAGDSDYYAYATEASGETVMPDGDEFPEGTETEEEPEVAVQEEDDSVDTFDGDASVYTDETDSLESEFTD